MYINFQRELLNLVEEAQAQIKIGRGRQNKVIYPNLLLWERNHSTYTIPDIWFFQNALMKEFPQPFPVISDSTSL